MKVPFLALLFAVLAIATWSCTSGPGNSNSSQANANRNTGQMPMNGNLQGMDHGNTSVGNANMEHSMVMQSAPDAANQPFDLQFIDSMSQHHQGAIMMAEMALQRAEHPELKQFAQKIIDDQRKEIAEMKGWRDKWYPGKPSAMNMEMPGMSTQQMMGGSQMQNMQSMQGVSFDLMFIGMMIPHHEGAISMSNAALQKAEHAEIKDLAQMIIKAQQSEIEQMKGWQQSWKK